MTAPFDENDALAGEFVLGLLDDEEERLVRRRLPGDAALASAVARWEHGLTGLGAALDPIEPPPGVKRAIGARIGPAPAAERPAPPAPSKPPSPPWFWQAAAAILAVIALGEAVLLFSASDPDPAPVVAERPARDDEPYVAVLSPAEGQAPILVSLDLPQGLLTVDPSGLEAGDRAVQLWLLPPGGGDPVSLGLLTPNTDNTVEVPVALAGLPQDALPSLAISLEPEGGSPTGTPTGPVFAAGEVRALRRGP